MYVSVSVSFHDDNALFYNSSHCCSGFRSEYNLRLLVQTASYPKNKVSRFKKRYFHLEIVIFQP